MAYTIKIKFLEVIVEEINKNISKNSKIILENRNTLALNGVEKADVATKQSFSCICGGVPLQISGENLEVVKLDISQGIVELKGEINSLKFDKEKKNILKRLFK